MEIFICLAILWILWLVAAKRWRRWLLQPLAILVVGYFIVVSPFGVWLLNWGLTAQLPADTGTPVDAIAILGRGPTLRLGRVTVAWQQWQEERASSIFASGMMDAQEIVNDLQAIGVPASALSGETCSQSTQENALFSAALLRPRNVQDILLITDPPHMWRSLLVFRSVGFNVIPSISSFDFEQLPIRRQVKSFLREYLALLDYALTGKLQMRPSAELDNPPPEVRQKLIDWNCQVEPRVISSG
jgi:uncharacterized SAM-binding protein YcdF (DUF218 family)